MNWVRVRNKATKEDISYFEICFDVKLPEDFKYIVEKHNGGRPERKLLNIEGKQYVFYSLLSISKNDRYNVYKIYSWVGDKIHKNLVPIAEDPFGNYYCYDKGDNMHIKLWKHDNEKLIYISDNLFDLLDLLKK